MEKRHGRRKETNSSPLRKREAQSLFYKTISNLYHSAQEEEKGGYSFREEGALIRRPPLLCQPAKGCIHARRKKLDLRSTNIRAAGVSLDRGGRYFLSLRRKKGVATSQSAKEEA